MEGDDPDPDTHGWVAQRPAGVGAVWRHGTQVRAALTPARDRTALQVEQALARHERVGSLDALANAGLEPAQQVPIDRYETPAEVKPDGAAPYKRTPPCGQQHFACWPFVGLEIVKRNGTYTVLENGRQVQPTRLSPEQQHLYDHNRPDWTQDGGIGTDEARALARQARGALLGELDPTHGALYYGLNTPPQLVADHATYNAPDEARASEQANPSPTMLSFPDGQLQDADAEQFRAERVNNFVSKPTTTVPLAAAVPTPTRYPAPLAARVRVEEGELPPDYVRVRARAVTLNGIEPTSGEVDVAEEAPLGEFDLPVGLASAPTSAAAVLPFPMHVPMPPRTVLVSQEPRRKELYDAWRRGEFKDDTKSGLFSYMRAPAFVVDFATPLRLLWWAGVTVAYRAPRGLYSLGRQLLRRRRLKARAQERASGTRRYTYGDDQVNVFDDLRGDLREIRTALLAGDAQLAKRNETIISDFVLNTYEYNAESLAGELLTTEMPGPRVDKLTGRVRALADFLFPALWFDPDPNLSDNELPNAEPKNIPQRNSTLEAKFVRNTQGYLAALQGFFSKTPEGRPQDLGELDARNVPNYADNSGMDGTFLSSHRSDLRYEVEIGDSQFDRPIKAVLVAHEQAGLMAGRVADNHDQLEQSFRELAEELKEFVADCDARLKSQENGWAAMLPVVGRDVQDAELKVFRATGAPADWVPKAWFMDRRPLHTDFQTRGVRKMSTQYRSESIWARMRELLCADFCPRARKSQLDRPDVDYEEQKRKVFAADGFTLAYSMLHFTNTVRLFRADPGLFEHEEEAEKFFRDGFLSADERDQYIARDAEFYKTFRTRKMLVPPFPRLKADHERARRATLPPDVIERRLPQLIKLTVPSAMRGWDPLQGTAAVGPSGAMAPLAPLGPACRRAARFVAAQIRSLVDDEVDAVHAAESRSGGDPDAPAADVGLPRRRRLQFVSLYRAKGTTELIDLDGFNHMTPLPPIFTPPSLPLGATLCNAAAGHLHAALRVLFGGGVLAMEDVLGAREAVPDVVRSEARNAFASILVNCLLARRRPSTSMVAHDVVESVVQQARRVALEVSRLIKAVYDYRSAAVLTDADELLRVLPEGPATRLALRHTGAWRTDWGGRRTVLRSDVWRVHVRAFADALGRTAADTKSHPALIPLLNIQTSYLAVRPYGPRPTDYDLADFAELNLFEARRSLARGRAMHAVDVAAAETHPVLDRMTFADLMLARPVLWRLPPEELERPLEGGDPLFPALPGGATPLRVAAISDVQLAHAWAARRVELPLRLLVEPLESPDDALEAALNSCVEQVGALTLRTGIEGTIRVAGDADRTRLSRRPKGRCTYYVPICCDVLPDLRQEYDPKVGLQLVAVNRMQMAGARLCENCDARETDDQIVLETLVLDRAEQSDADDQSGGRTPAHPLFMRHDPAEPETLRAHVPSMPVIGGAALGWTADALGIDAANAPAVSPASLMDAMAQLSALGADRSLDGSPSTRDERVDKVAAALVDARRTLIHATDRIYQALLHAMLLRSKRAEWAEEGAADRRWVLRLQVQQMWPDLAADDDDEARAAAENYWAPEEAGLRTEIADQREAMAAGAAPAAPAPPSALVRQQQRERMQLPLPADPFAHRTEALTYGTRDAQETADKRMLVAAALIALTLLPDDANVDLEFADLYGLDDYDATLGRYQNYSGRLLELRASEVPLSELVAFLVVHCCCEG